MPKSITLGNGNILICLDKHAQVRDFYYHYAGLENHIGGNLVHKIGIWVEEKLTWIDDPSWNINIDVEKGTMASCINAENSSLGLKIFFTDVVYNEKNIFIREIKIENLFDRNRKIKVFFNQQFNIGETNRKDTAYYEPDGNVVIHYEGRRVFLINLRVGKSGIKEYSTGLLGLEGKEGTFKDSEDGELTGNPVEHGQVDSVVSADIELASKKSKTFYYWMIVSKSVEKVKELNNYVLDKSPSYIVKSTKDYWSAWVKNQNFSFYGLSDQIIELFNESLVNIRTHVSHNGAIVASGDSDMLYYGRDTYSYVWPRDAAISAIALAKSGDFNASRRFFEYCNEIISPKGYFLHKYRPDKSVGSSWHPWIRDGKPTLPIQEDETALVIYALWIHFELSKDLEFIETIYNSLIKSAAEFMVSYRDKKTGLPNPSYDLWEMKYGIHTFTASSVYNALSLCGKFAKLLGKETSAAKYYKAASEIKDGIIKYLYNSENKAFYKHINIKKGKIVPDKTIDISSVYGLYKFEVLPFDDPKLKKAIEVTRDRLTVKTDTGGIARFEGDQYHSKGGNIPGNPWFITTLWMTQYDIEFIKKESELPDLVKQFTWVVDRAQTSGILSEQLDAYTGEQLSAAPLTWSHAEYVITVIKYLEKLEKLGICKACYPVK